MLRPLLWTVGILAFIIVGWWIMDVNTQDKTFERTSMEVSGLLESALVGKARLGTDGGVSRQEAIANIIGSIVESQKNHGNDLKVEYVFLDENLQPTTVDEQIDSIQYRLTMYDEDYDVTSEVEKRISLDFKDGKRKNNVADIYERKVTTGVSSNPTQTFEVTLPNLKELRSVTVDNGSVDYKVDGEVVTVTVSGGTQNEYVVSGSYSPEMYKVVYGQTSPTYSDAEGYSGTLTQYVESGEAPTVTQEYVTRYEKETGDKVNKDGTLTVNRNGVKGTLVPFETKEVIEEGMKKWVTNYALPSYLDDEGYSGTLEPYVAGYLTDTEVDRKYIENYPQSKYPNAEDDSGNGKDKDGYSGTLEGKSVKVESKYVSEKYPLTMYGSTSIAYNQDGYSGKLSYINDAGWEELKTNVTNNVMEVAERGTYVVNLAQNNRYTMVNAQGTKRTLTYDMYSSVVDSVSKVTYKDKTTGEEKVGYFSSSESDVMVWNRNVKTSEKVNEVGRYDSVLNNKLGKDNWSLVDIIPVTLYQKMSYKQEQELYGLFGGTVTKYKTVYSGYVSLVDDSNKIYKYQGWVEKPENARTVTYYRGTLTRTTEDTRVYKYRGVVTKPSVDTRKYETGYQYVIRLQYK